MSDKAQRLLLCVYAFIFSSGVFGIIIVALMGDSVTKSEAVITGLGVMTTAAVKDILVLLHTLPLSDKSAGGLSDKPTAAPPGGSPAGSV